MIQDELTVLVYSPEPLVILGLVVNRNAMVALGENQEMKVMKKVLSAAMTKDPGENMVTAVTMPDLVREAVAAMLMHNV
jgi:hypothetical protein